MWNLKKSALMELLPKVKGKYSTNVSLAKYTWFGVGGSAEVFFQPLDEKDLQNFLKKKPHNIPVSLIGGGSNLLIRDGGISGVVIKLSSKYFKQVVVEDSQITCFAGTSNVGLKKVLLDNEIGGLEFLISIPGVIGGSIKTNAGCFGSCVSDFIVGATVVDNLGQIHNIGLSDLKLSYRSSLFPDDWIIISITFRREYKPRAEIEKILLEHKNYRMQNQPYNAKTAGSTFKNPEGLRAWELIKKSGCANLQIGGAKVSEKHCNFLINIGNATAKDIETLGETIINNVKKQTSITLEWEIKRLGVNK